MRGRRVVAAAGVVAVGGVIAAGPAAAATAHKEFSVIVKTVSEKNSKTGFTDYEKDYTPAGKLVGRDILSCTVIPSKTTFSARCEVFFSYSGRGDLYGRLTLGESPAVTGTVYKGTGAFKGYTGKVYALGLAGDNAGTAVTFELQK